MHPALQKIFMVRDQDLARWGRPIAILKLCLAIVCWGSALTVRRMVDDKIAPALREMTTQEVVVLERYSTSVDDASIARLIRGRRNVDEGMLRAARACSWILAGAGLIALSHAAMSWRAYDLVTSARAKSQPSSQG